MKIDLNTPVSAINRVGKVVASRLNKLGIETVSDLIFYYPFRWQDFSQIVDIAKLQPGQDVTVYGKIQLINNRRSQLKRKIITEAIIADKTGSIKVIWFNQPFLTSILNPGDEVYLSGRADFDRYNLQFISPIYEKANRSETTHTARLVPIYSLSSNLTEKQIRFLIKSVLPLADSVKDCLPPEVIIENQLFILNSALKQIHFPSNGQLLDEAIRRLKFDELFLFQLKVLANKAEINSSISEPINFAEAETKEFVNSLPFKLTNDQRKASWQIISDLSRSYPMNRLLEGDVGSGKTIVAAIALFNASLAEKQSVLMAPTEILAVQHYQNIRDIFKNYNISISFLSGSQSLENGQKADKKKILKKIKSGEIKIVIGTHALIQQEVSFKNLSLAIIDEQHRFGVAQRKLLREKSGNPKIVPHLLSMTATPIPRSLALSLYGDLDLSLIREMPKERRKIITKVVNQESRQLAYNFIRSQIYQGRQVFIICPLVDPSDKLGVKSVKEEYERLKKNIFPDLKISIIHGKLKSVEREKIMAEFIAKKNDILVATSVIEVGVDIPNASVILIEGAERFGLAQLHQFRGRVGRSIYQSYCFLLTENNSQKTQQRLQALLNAKDGFELAEFDLQFRGPGEIYGVIQSGFPEFKIAQLTDAEIINQAKISAEKILKKGLSNYPLLKDKVNKSIKNIHLE